MNCVILTGIPRSGTTLSCYLLNKLPEVVALHEPLDLPTLLEHSSQEAICDGIIEACREIRQTLLTRNVAVSRHCDGVIPDRHVSDLPSATGLRESKAELGEIAFPGPLDNDFLLVIKHPVAFTALLSGLIKRFRCFAVLRNPLAVLGSWNSVDMRCRDGRAPYAEQVDTGLQRALAAHADRFDRQLALLDWFFEVYAKTLPAENIIRYEDMVSSGGSVLQCIAPTAAGLKEPLESMNCAQAYDRQLMNALAVRLLNRESACWHYYDRESVEALMQ